MTSFTIENLRDEHDNRRPKRGFVGKADSEATKQPLQCQHMEPGSFIQILIVRQESSCVTFLRRRQLDGVGRADAVRRAKA